MLSKTEFIYKWIQYFPYGLRAVWYRYGLNLSLVWRQDKQNCQNRRQYFFVVTTRDICKTACFSIRVTNAHTYRIMRHVLFTTHLCHQPNMRLNLRKHWWRNTTNYGLNSEISPLGFYFSLPVFLSSDPWEICDTKIFK